MRLERKDIIEQPADDILILVRDEMPKLVPYLQNVARIEVIEREDISENKVRIVNQWYAKAEIPSVAKKFVKPELLSWKDHAMWTNDEYRVDFELESLLANNLFEVKGTNTFGPHEDNEEHTLIHVSCEVKIYPENIPGVPGFLAKRVKPMVENLIEGMLGPNLTSLGQGLMQYFGQNG